MKSLVHLFRNYVDFFCLIHCILAVHALVSDNIFITFQVAFILTIGTQDKRILVMYFGSHV